MSDRNRLPVPRDATAVRRALAAARGEGQSAARIVDAEFSPVPPALPVRAPDTPPPTVPKQGRGNRAAAAALRAALADAERAYRQAVEDAPACGRRIDIEI